MIDYVVLDKCNKCGAESITEDTFNEIHGHRYTCSSCKFTCWGGRKKNEDKNKKRPPYPSPEDLKIYSCDICHLGDRYLGYSETLETHHKDGDATNNDRNNLWVLCSVCHKLVHHQRQYRGVHFMMKYASIVDGAI